MLRLVLLFLLASGSPVLGQSVPANAVATYGGGWACNLGYRRTGNQCEEVDVPANAVATYGGGWACNLGFKRQGSSCVQMTEAERRAQLEALAAMAARARREKIEGYDFSLRDIERNCEAYVYSPEYGELNCRGLREIEQKCEVYIYDWPHGEIDCRGSDFRQVERSCNVEMYSDVYGEVSC